MVPGNDFNKPSKSTGQQEEGTNSIRSYFKGRIWWFCEVSMGSISYGDGWRFYNRPIPFWFKASCSSKSRKWVSYSIWNLEPISVRKGVSCPSICSWLCVFRWMVIYQSNVPYVIRWTVNVFFFLSGALLEVCCIFGNVTGCFKILPRKIFIWN